MRGYPRPAPAFRWYNWWYDVALRTYERDDDDAVLAAEDEAIRAAENDERVPDGTFELPASLAHLVNLDDAAPDLHAGGEAGSA